MIAVCIVTYNHESFIAQCIESVLAQVCDEPIRIYIGDDASTDNTQSICEQYAATDERIVYIRREKNTGLVCNTIDLYYRIMADGCEYIAMLDGDDYWIDAHKLQLQIDYLRTHPECGFIHSAAYEENDGKLSLPPQAPPVGDLHLCYNLVGARHTNCTVLFRTCLLDKEVLSTIQQQAFPVLDYPLYGLLAQKTYFAFLPTPTAVWRNHTSVSNPMGWQRYSAYKRERIRMWRWLCKTHPSSFHFSSFQARIWYFKQILSFFFTKKHTFVCTCKKKVVIL
jgi:glycosyltransferase involved in cell wall biosynthesis